MTAPVFVFTPETIEPADAVASAGPGTILMLTGPEARHAVTVKRLRMQERVDLLDGGGQRLVCEVTGAGVGGAKDRLAVRVLERIEEPTPPLRLTLVQALAKGGRDEQEAGTGELPAGQVEGADAVGRAPPFGEDDSQPHGHGAAQAGRHPERVELSLWPQDDESDTDDADHADEARRHAPSIANLSSKRRPLRPEHPFSAHAAEVDCTLNTTPTIHRTPPPRNGGFYYHRTPVTACRRRVAPLW